MVPNTSNSYLVNQHLAIYTNFNSSFTTLKKSVLKLISNCNLSFIVYAIDMAIVISLISYLHYKYVMLISI